MSVKIPYGRQHITEEDIAAVTTTLQSDFLTQGPVIGEFEKTFAQYVGSKYAVAVSNGTAALHLSAMALGFGNGQKVITTPITFSASANCIEYCGATVDFVDIDPQTYLMDLDQLEAKLQGAKAGEYVGVVPVDFAGRSIDMPRVGEIANKYGLKVLEDACHAPGGSHNGDEAYQCGNGAIADAAIFSFHPVKHIASGEGGMITTNDESIYERLMVLRTHGITRDTSIFQNTPSLATGIEQAEDWPGWYMEMQELGYNYRLSDIQAALGLSQLKRAEEGLKRRRAIARTYEQAFSGKPYIKGESGVVKGHAYHLYVVEVDDRLGLYQHLRAHGIFAQVHYIPVHIMPFYREKGWKPGDFPHAEKYYSRCLSLPMYPTLTDEEQAFVIETIGQFYE